jgi:hypothetical protein
MGATTLVPALQLLKWIKPKEELDPGKAICCSAYGNVTWHCPLLQQLRNMPL